MAWAEGLSSADLKAAGKVSRRGLQLQPPLWIAPAAAVSHRQVMAYSRSPHG